MDFRLPITTGYSLLHELLAHPPQNVTNKDYCCSAKSDTINLIESCLNYLQVWRSALCKIIIGHFLMINRSIRRYSHIIANDGCFIYFGVRRPSSHRQTVHSFRGRLRSDDRGANMYAVVLAKSHPIGCIGVN